MANNSSGARSVHLRQDHRSRARAGRRALRRIAWRTSARWTTPSSSGACAGDDARRRVLPDGARSWPRRMRDEIERRFPEGAAPRRRLQPRRVRRAGAAVQPGEADGRVGGHARRRARGQAQPGAAAEGQGGAGDPVRRSARIAGGDAAHPAARAVGGRGDGQVHPRPHAAERGARRPCARASSTAIPGALLCVEFYADAPRTCRRGCRRSKRTCARTASATAITTRSTWPAQARIWSLREAALGLSMAMKDDAKSMSFVEDTAVPPERLRDYIERFLAHRRAATAPRPASTPTPRSAACTCGRSST